MIEVLYSATKYMNAEDALLVRKEKPRKRERQEDTRQDPGGGGRKQGLETGGMKGTLSPQGEDS